MPATSEPPWLNKSSGTAARNGTTSHTISFGFTSTSGSLLVAIVHGAVTHTVSGWTEQAQPVATGECSLFTKTSAGDSSITVTHNGSDYPVNYVIYEFPAGSTVTGVDSTTGSNDTMPGLSGLPGTEQVIIGALGRVTIGSETNGSISPSAPWVEDGDLFAAASGTDGSYLAVVHQLNVTATSITPTISPTYSGTWSNGSREKISAAFDVAAATTVNGTAALASSSSLTGAATVVQNGSATAGSSSSLTGAATVVQHGQATPGSMSTLTAAATVHLLGVAALASASTLTAAAVRIIPATAVLASASTLTGHVGSMNQPGQMTTGAAAATARGQESAATALTGMWP